MSFTSKSQPFAVRFKRLAVPKLDAKGKKITTKSGDTRMEPGRFPFKVKCPVGKRADYEAHWQKEGLNTTTTLDGLLNQMEKQSKEGFKADTRTAILDVEARIYTPQITLKDMIIACRADPAVVKALEEMQINVTGNHIGQPRNKDLTKAKAADFGIALAQADPDRFRAIAKELGIELD